MNAVPSAVEYAVPAEVQRFQRRAFLVGAVGLLVSSAGVSTHPDQFLRSYLVAYFFVTGISLGSLAILMLQHLSGGAWGLLIRRPLEAAASLLPLTAVLFVPIALGLPQLYEWARPEAVAHDVILQHKHAYLNVPFFLTRAAIYFVLWIGGAWLLTRWSHQQDQAPEGFRDQKFRALSGPGLLLWGVTVTFASIDWVMSLDPHWFSTMFGLMIIAGQGLAALAFAIAVLFSLSRYQPLGNALQPTHFHDLGKLLLAFVMLWAYLSFSQFLIIWSANLPEEIPWYLARLAGGWQWVALLLLVAQFLLPFLLLLSRDTKRNAQMLARIALLVVALRFVDHYWLIAPAFSSEGLRVHWLDLTLLIGLGGLWLGFFLWQLRGRPLLPINDPHLEEALAHGHH